MNSSLVFSSTTSSLRPTAPAIAALRVENVTLDYSDGINEDGSPRAVRALDSVDFSADAGTITALVGPSGSGKSSLLAVAATLIRPSSGTVYLADRELTGLPEKELAQLRRSKIGMIFQQPNLLPSLTAREQLVLTAHLRGGRRAELKKAAAHAGDLLELVGLSGSADRRPHQLSGGQRQRVNIARALMSQPQVMLVDEPTAALDHQRSQEVMELLVEVTRRFGTATVVVTHDTEFVPLADRSVTMRHGRLN